MNNKYIELIRNPWKIFIHLNNKKLINWMPDELFLKLAFRAIMKKKLDIKNPKSYSEKLQWLKLYDRQPKYITMVDKYEVKKYVADLIGEEYIIPTLGVWDKFEDIDFDSLPNRFVLKCTHDSGGLVICKDKSKLDLKATRDKINKCLNTNFYYHGREWPYKNVRPRIIAEKYMEDKSSNELKDYKFFCFEGDPKAMFIASERGDETRETKFDFYDMNFKHLPFINGHPNSDTNISKPLGFEEMKHLASILSKDIPHIRVDFYDINGKIYFGELTLFHWSGLMPFEPESWDYTFGEWIKLPNKEVKYG